MTDPVWWHPAVCALCGLVRIPADQVTVDPTATGARCWWVCPSCGMDGTTLVSDADADLLLAAGAGVADLLWDVPVSEVECDAFAAELEDCPDVVGQLLADRLPRDAAP